MEPAILVIQCGEIVSFVESFPDEEEARAALVRHVRGQPPRSCKEHASDDAQAVADWFGTGKCFYAISRLTPGDAR